MKILFDAPERNRMPNLLIVGSAGNGKTHILSRFEHLHPASDRPDRYSSSVPVVAVRAPAVADRGELFSRMLRRLAVPHKMKDSAAHKMQSVIEEMHKVGTRVLLIDEVHDLLNGSKLQQRQAIGSLKDFSNESRISIVAAGTAAARTALSVDDQLWTRFDALELPRWDYGPDFKRLLASFEKLLPLPEPSFLANPAKSMKIYEFTGSTIGKIAKLIMEAAITAVNEGKPAITIEILTEAGEAVRARDIAAQVK